MTTNQNTTTNSEALAVVNAVAEAAHEVRTTNPAAALCTRYREDIASLLDLIASSMDESLREVRRPNAGVRWDIEAQMARIRWHLIETTASCNGWEPTSVLEHLAEARSLAATCEA